MREQVQGSVWDKVFKISERGSSVSRELFAGATTFLCVSYVLAVNPAILGAAGMDVGAVFTATAVSAIIMTLLLALYSNMPFAGYPVWVSMHFLLTLLWSKWDIALPLR